ncbi:MAG: UDP-N-acetylmuramate--L-alanine ligase [Ignavibacteria bacterium RIFOXYB2_FULL_35_12]|nr:MAG: UDP-N-acetylmuramate--L-alanine ligase [Ignavibacteria bacterium GWA2_36_19]OGU61339.1 MAG: UDP-N-acetylmuramate--L-alanine ligase [Ignavibacteria bacterium GWF2_35_20]OGU88450.1 MAG: UDP-N-acetylmuramate--L-alanine ligase [Ignavibacteria bacterium RIFOXYA12_FULL_35_25]OGU92463.1 MAG: UDP-N-acetylmuramate--L-alanine ligase [Ignavibacteria bacterium RIFOXYC12_FULL_35_11]OGU95842.1 MAG: UDP-N-acetylmuramate--L-alanine ligase [Ignavibacteria bacterium RIFOXYB12_FULL_35_14]OGV00920.1 MAG: 
MFKNIKKVHFVGIGGIGMSGIAEILLNQGFEVSGSDQNLSEITRRLSDLGMKIYEGHSAENLKDADVLVYSSAVTVDNPEVEAAVKRKIPIIKRSEMLAECMRMQYGIGIAGTHGKTTTTSMVGLTLTEGKLDPTIIVGGKLSGLGGTNARLGNGEFIVVEADEFDRTFLKLTPTIAVITTLESEHLDTYKDLEDIKSAFIEFANKVPFYGFVVLCLDEPALQDIIPQINKKVITYGLTVQADLRATDIEFKNFTSSFNVKYYGEELGRLTLKIPGIHNVKNSLVAVSIAKELGVSFSTIKKALESFAGVYRRFEVKYNKEIMVVDDYAHHPTETSASLAGIRSGWDRRLVAVFQPHLFSRTRDFYQEFGRSFLNSDIFVCTDIYPAREEPIEGVTGKLITDAAQSFGHKNVLYVENKNDIVKTLNNLKKDGDIIVTMGAGDIWKFGEKFVEGLNKK